MKTIIYIEANDEKVPEYNFLKLYIEHLGLGMKVQPIAGKDNLDFLSAKLHADVFSGNKPVILFDADELRNGGGYAARMAHITQFLANEGLGGVPVFLWPNNHDDGDFETMLENIVQKQLHPVFFDCFEDYEHCVAGKYTVPNRKSKLHTFINAQPGLSNSQKKKLGHGNWLFNDKNYWDWDAAYLQPLRDFLINL